VGPWERTATGLEKRFHPPERKFPGRNIPHSPKTCWQDVKDITAAEIFQ